MKKLAIRTLALLVIFTMMASMVTSCSSIKEKFSFLNETREEHESKKKKDKKHRDDDDDEEETEATEETEETEETQETEEPDPTDTPAPTMAPINSEYADPSNLVFPDEPYDYNKVHPKHEPGSLNGKEAKEELYDIEHEYIEYMLDGSYIDTVIEFYDYEDLGYSYDNVSMGDVSVDTSEDMKVSQEFIDRLLAIDFEDLDENDRIFYDKILYDLEEQVYLDQYPGFQYLTPVFNSLTSQQCNLFFVVDIVSFKNKQEAEDYILLMKDIDRYYDQLCEFEEARVSLGYYLSPDAYEDIAKTFDDLVAMEEDCFLYESYRARLDEVDELTDDEKEALSAEHDQVMKEIVFPEFKECASRMRAIGASIKNDNYSGIGTYEHGTDYYEAIVRKDTNSQTTPDEAAAYCDEYLKQCYVDILTGYMNGDYSDDHDYTKGDMQENLDYLYGQIFEYFPEIPDHEYVFKEVPEAFRDSFSPAAFLAYHIDRYDSNLLLVNSAKDSGDFGTTVAHEAYPGHMYQSVYTRSVTDHLYMVISTPDGYAEGWAEYVEVNSPQFFGASEDEVKYLKQETRFNTLLMARIDLGCNYEGWTCEEACDYINDILDEAVVEVVGKSMGMDILTPDAIMDAYLLVANDPGYAVHYGIGYIVLTNTLDEIQELDPSMSKKELHKLFLDCQTAPFEQILETAKRKLGK